MEQKPETPQADARATSDQIRERARHISDVIRDSDRSLKSGIDQLAHLVKVSKGAGKPAVGELLSLFAAVYGLIDGLNQKQTLLNYQLGQQVAQTVVQMEVLKRLLLAKGLITTDELETTTTEFVKESQAKAVERVRAERKAAFEAAQGAELPTEKPAILKS